ncbi:TonB-dependent receptor plug domain-containing protein [Halosquirtibacter laminarini]|uniref:TonB-dependent receptor plug domain-containing protein n=1 Tax=Halosquirtibacter laminarini TaxID=3374600 RepID=A0AC61NBS1_9BACT|nr:TonB-dependent receptor plug domain-containing protein [Prolixibacteraceae bacterium]
MKITVINRSILKIVSLRLAISLFVILAVSLSSFAQTEATKDTVQLGSIDIKRKSNNKYIAGKSITKISSQILQNNSVENLGAVVLQKSAIYSQQQGRGGAMYLSIRGTGKNHTEVTWNGIPLNSPLYGTVDFSLIPTQVVDQASIFFGGSATSESNSNIGGAVTLRTFPNLSQTFRGKASLSIGSYETYKASTALYYPISEKLTASTKLYYSASQNDFTYTNTYKVVPNETGDGWVNPTETNTMGDWLTTGGLQEFFYKFNENTRLSIHYWGQYNNRSIPMIATSEANDTDSDKENRSITTSHRSSIQLYSSIWDWNVSVSSAFSHEKNHFWYKDNATGYSMNDDQSTQKNTFNQLKAYKEINEKLILRLGAQVNYLTMNTENLIQYQTQKSHRGQQILSLKSDYQIADFIHTSLSLQNQWNEGKSSGLIPFFGTNISLLDQERLDLTASVNRNYRFPTLNDQYAIPGGNPGLKEESGWAYSIGGQNTLHKAKFTFQNSLEYYHSDIDNWIEWKPSDAGYWTPSNKEKVRSYGFTVKQNTRWNASKELQIDLDLHYNYSKTVNRSTPVNTYDDSYNKQLPYTPVHVLTSSIGATYRQFESSLHWSIQSMQYSTSDNDTNNDYGTIDGYHLADIDFKYHQKIKNKEPMTYTLSIYNLTDQTYESVVAQPMPGINFQFSIQYQF